MLSPSSFYVQFEKQKNLIFIVGSLCCLEWLFNNKEIFKILIFFSSCYWFGLVWFGFGQKYLAAAGTEHTL
jgi:hypothetical protein